MEEFLNSPYPMDTHSYGSSILGIFVRFSYNRIVLIFVLFRIRNGMVETQTNNQTLLLTWSLLLSGSNFEANFFSLSRPMFSRKLSLIHALCSANEWKW